MISIIVPTYNHCYDLLKPCLESIIKYTDLTNVEVIVVANGCKDNTEEYVLSLRQKNIDLLWFDEGLGFIKATNEGIKAAKGDIIVFLNNDVVLLEQPKNSWLDRLVKPLKDDVGVTCPVKIWSPDAERDFAVFFCSAIRKDMFDKVGLLDEVFHPGYGDDIDFSIRVEQAGFRVVQVSNVIQQKDGMNVIDFPIYHKGEATMLDSEHSEEWYKTVKRNQKILQDKYKLPRGWFYGEDVKEYRRLMEDLPDSSMVCELGCAAGRSICSVADIIKRKHLDVTLIDTFQGTVNERAPGQGPDEYMDEAIANTKRFGLEVKAIRAWTTEACKDIANETFDLIFIDADHAYEAVKKDLKDWIPKVTKGGIICGHDYNNGFGVSKAVNEIWNNIRLGGSVWSKRL